MSPLALFYLMLAGSPVFNTFENTYSKEWMHPESSVFSPEWMHSESSIFNNEWMHPESSIFNTESSTRFNSLLRKAIRNPWTSTRRSIVRELTGVESPMWSSSNTFETESMLPIIRNIRNIRRIAEVNPIMIEKILTRPESRVAVEALLRHVEPETLLLVEKLIRKNIPTYLREKVARRVVKSLIRSTMEPRRSILSELYPTSSMESSIFSNIFESPVFESSVFGVEPKIVKVLIEKLLRRSEVPEVVLSKIVRKIVKSSIRRHSELPFETLSTSVFGRRHHNVEKVALKQIEKVAELKALLSHLRHESVYSTPSVWTIRRIVKLVRDIAAPEHVIVKSAMKKALRNGNVEVFCNYCEDVCESTTRMTYSHICHVCHETCSEITPFAYSSVHMNKERLVRKLVKSIVSKKSSKKYSKVEKLCRVCDNVCESSSRLSAVFPTELTFSTLSTPSVCRVCEEVCGAHSNIFSRHSESKVLRRLVKSSIYSSPLETSSIFGGRKSFAEKKILNKIVKAALFEQF